MAEEVKVKRPVPKGFQKKPVEKVEQVEQLSDPPVEIIVSQESLQKSETKTEVDMAGLIKDLMFNRFFLIMEKEARPIAEKMVSEGSLTLHDVKWFLAFSERVQLAKELKEKYGLS